jgi:hypothetical protein
MVKRNSTTKGSFLHLQPYPLFFSHYHLKGEVFPPLGFHSVSGDSFCHAGQWPSNPSESNSKSEMLEPVKKKSCKKWCLESIESESRIQVVEKDVKAPKDDVEEVDAGDAGRDLVDDSKVNHIFDSDEYRYLQGYRVMVLTTINRGKTWKQCQQKRILYSTY